MLYLIMYIKLYSLFRWICFLTCYVFENRYSTIQYCYNAIVWLAFEEKPITEGIARIISRNKREAWNGVILKMQRRDCLLSRKINAKQISLFNFKVKIISLCLMNYSHIYSSTKTIINPYEIKITRKNCVYVWKLNMFSKVTSLLL